MTGTRPTPQEIRNRPGLSEIRRRAGTHGTFRESLVRGLASVNRPGTAELRSREPGDVSVALLDAWAGVCDTLTFYAERTANEAYLRTATERISLRRQGRLIGYELAPAKAASVHLAFVAEEGDAPEETLEYDSGLQVRSVPRDGELPQVFETIEPLTARSDWNALKPRTSRPQELAPDDLAMQLIPEAPRLKAGDAVAFLRGGSIVAFAPDSGEPTLLRRVTAEEEGIGRRRVVSMTAEAPPPPGYFTVYFPLFFNWSVGTPVQTTTLQTNVAQQSWTISTLAKTTALTGLSLFNLTLAIQALPYIPLNPILPHRMRVKAACFGHNAVTRLTTPVENGGTVTGTAYSTPVQPSDITATALQAGDLPSDPETEVHIYLDREYEEATEGSIALLRAPGREAWVKIDGVETVSVEAYGQSGKVTRLKTAASGTGADGSTVDLDGFPTRRTSVFCAPEALPLAELPITEDVGAPSGDLGADAVELSGPQLFLLPGKTVALTGERSDLVGVTETEILEVAEATLQSGFTTLTFTANLAHPYKRETVTINANVAEATHGETVMETVGDGDARVAFQSFTLKSKPVTHVAARTESGMTPALEILVDGVLWDRVDDFRDAGPEDRVYLLRMEEDGSGTIVFGDGIRGARPPTGQGNIEAAYRKGAGEEGMLEAGQITLLATKPRGLKSVSNPLPPAGGAPAEAIEDARSNAPLKVLTLGRVVSVRDYADFARAFAAVAKARADWAWDGFDRPIYLTVAGTGGAELPESGEDMKNLVAALKAAGDPGARVTVRNYVPAYFRLKARLYLDPAFTPDLVMLEAEAALRAAFGFEGRALGQPASRAEAYAVLQGVSGVIGVDVDLFHRTDGDEDNLERLPAGAPRSGLRGVPEPAELLTLSPEPPILEPVQ